LSLAGLEGKGFANDKIALLSAQLLENLQGIQRRQNLTLSPEMKKTPVRETDGISEVIRKRICGAR